MKRMAMVACAAVLSIASASYAELAKVGLPSQSPNGVAVVSTTNVTASGVNDLNLGNIDLVSGLTLTATAAGGTATVDFLLNNPATGPQGETPFLLFATSVSGTVRLTSLSIGTGSGGGFSLISAAAPAPNLTLTTSAAGNRFVGVYTGAIPTYTTFRAIFTFTGIGDSVSIDMVSNPEPGTWALFAFGLAGMAAFAWRRRNAAKLALAKSSS